MKRFLLIILILCSGTYSQVFHGTFTDYRHPDRNLYLYDFIDLVGQPVDSCRVDSQGKFSFTDGEYAAGLYQLRGAIVRPLYFILNPQENEIEVQITKNGNKQEVLFLKSKENQAYQKYFHNLTRACSDLEKEIYIKTFHRIDSAAAKINETNLSNIKRYLFTGFSELESTYPGTITHQIIKQLIPETDVSYNIRLANYFKNKTILDVTYLRTPLVYHKVNTFLKYYSGANRVDLDFSIDDILLMVAENDLSFKKCVSLVLGYLDSVNDTRRIEYVVDKYVGEELDIIDNPQLRTKIEGRYRLKIGTTAPDISVPNQEGETISLHTLFKKSRVNLLMFWASTCSHCVKELPKIIKLYNKYHTSGFNVVAISLDRSDSDWRNAIRHWSLEWDNLSDLKGWDSRSTDLYFTTITPSFYLVDDNHKIIGRPNYFSQLTYQVAKLLD